MEWRSSELPGIDKKRTFLSVQIAVLTISDSRTVDDDRSGDVLVARLESAGHTLVERKIVPDDKGLIGSQLASWIDDSEIDVVLATGGTGVTGRDVSPEVFEELFEKHISGFGELFRMLSFEKIGTSTIQSRATAGVVAGTYLFLVPGSPGACMDAWDGILVHQLDNRYRPCNFVELMPRLTEV